jgi:hypothetical protein
VQRKAQKRNRTTEGSVKLCQEGIERVQRVHQRTPFRVPRKGKCRREDTHRVVEHSVEKGSARCASSRRMPGGHEAFLYKKYFRSEFSEILCSTRSVRGWTYSKSRSSGGTVPLHTEKQKKGVEGRETL